MPGKIDPFYTNALKRHNKRSMDRKQNKAIKVLKTQVKALTKADEKKYKDEGILQSPSTTVQKWPINTFTVWGGTDNNVRHEQREGQSIVMTSLRMRGLVEILQDATSPDENNRVRIMVVYSPDSSTPANLSDVLADSTQIDSHYRIKPPEPYKILFDKTYNLQCPAQEIPSAFNSSSTVTATERFRIPVRINLGKKAFGKSGTKASWIVGAGNVAPSRGALTLMSFSDSSIVSHPQLTLQSRLRYLDN